MSGILIFLFYMGTIISVAENWERRNQACKVQISVNRTPVGKRRQLIIKMTFYAYAYFLHISVFVIVSKDGYH